MKRRSGSLAVPTPATVTQCPSIRFHSPGWLVCIYQPILSQTAPLAFRMLAFSHPICGRGDNAPELRPQDFAPALVFKPLAGVSLFLHVLPQPAQQRGGCRAIAGIGSEIAGGVTRWCGASPWTTGRCRREAQNSGRRKTSYAWQGNRKSSCLNGGIPIRF
jgi:hypothetical protein